LTSSPDTTGQPESRQATNPQSQQQQQPEAGEETGEGFADPADEALVASAAERVSPSASMAAVVDVALKGDISANTLADIASQLGASPEEARGQIEAVRGVFERQALATVAAAGAEPEDLLDWVHSGADPEAAKLWERAMLAHATERSTKGYTEVAQRYVASMDQHSADAILGAELGEGVQVRQGPHGVVVTTPSGTVPWSVAVRMGLIRVSRRQ
jgi:hypothetical protein